MVDSWYCLDRVVPERMRQVSKWSEVGNHKRRTLNTRLSSGTSAHTSSRLRNAPGRTVWSDLILYQNKLKMKPTYREKIVLDDFFRGFRFTLKGGPEHWKLLYYSPLWANAKYLSKLNPIVQKPSLNFATWNLFKKTYLLIHQCKVGRNTYRNTNLRWDSIDFFENLSKTPNLETHVRIRYKETN